MNKKNSVGLLSFEGALILTIIVMFLATIYAILNILNPAKIPNDKPSQLIIVFQNILNRMDKDIRYANSVQVTSSTITLKRNDEKQVAYIVENGSLFLDEDGKKTTLIRGLYQGKFWIHPDLPSLVSVLFVPSDRMAFPFFTSFAIRGISK
ncbi:MAG: hypothetical protein HQM08_03875 [Candidatus Riflebacteria bacterium]|nr:hypothetical protein [Candidatus Riflebacteria bacterium]